MPTEYRTRLLAMVRYLRIAVTVLSLMACVLLIALWVRSYWWHEALRGRFQILNGHGWLVGSHGWDKSWQVLYHPDNGPPRTMRWAFGFAVRNYGGSCHIGVQHWLLVLLTSALAAAPWIFWRFSLRTLLIATTLVAVVLGMIVMAR